MNYITNQDVAITSPLPGTTTDVVEKAIELPPLGPVLFLDTAGLDDTSDLAEDRLKKTTKIFNRVDMSLLILEPDTWTAYEDTITRESKKRDVPVIGIINKCDAQTPQEGFLKDCRDKMDALLCLSSVDEKARDQNIHLFKKHVISLCPEDFIKPLPLIGDLVAAGGLVMLIVPIDLQAPKGRLILPQVQTIRDTLDHDAACMVVKEREYAHYLRQLRIKPDIVVCDSQVVLKMVADTPADIKCTTFSILFARNKGNLITFAKGAAVLDRMLPADKILISESCSHHPIEDDIGRVKIPRWIRQYLGRDIAYDVCCGKDFPDNLKEYRLIIQCGGCMTNRREMLSRVELANEQGIAITNYGLCISLLQGVLERVLQPFPAALMAYQDTRKA